MRRRPPASVSNLAYVQRSLSLWSLSASAWLLQNTKNSQEQAGTEIYKNLHRSWRHSGTKSCRQGAHFVKITEFGAVRRLRRPTQAVNCEVRRLTGWAPEDLAVRLAPLAPVSDPVFLGRRRTEVLRLSIFCFGFRGCVTAEAGQVA